jgi:uncharacterized protein (TIGR00159 family)
MESNDWDIIISLLFIAGLFYLLRKTTAKFVFLIFLALYAGRIILLKHQLYISADILGGLILIGGLGVIFIFNKDILRYFQKIGSSGNSQTKGLFNAFVPSTNDKHITESIVNDALKALMSQQEGALIIINENDNADTFCSGGIQMNADLTKELLVSVFQKTSPIHDGAVLISNKKIVSAGLILPLSQSSALNDKGTRHRAAAGISELCDCSVFVLSEENGQISQFKNGQIEA